MLVVISAYTLRGRPKWTSNVEKIEIFFLMFIKRIKNLYLCNNGYSRAKN